MRDYLIYQKRNASDYRNLAKSQISQLVWLNCRVGHQGNMPGSLNGHSYLSLMPGTVAGDTPGNNLPPLSNEVFQKLRILIIDLHT